MASWLIKLLSLQWEFWNLLLKTLRYSSKTKRGFLKNILREHNQSTANYFNLAFRTDAILYWYKDREIVELMLCFINAVLKMQKGEAPTEEEINAFIRLMEDRTWSRW